MKHFKQLMPLILLILAGAAGLSLIKYGSGFAEPLKNLFNFSSSRTSNPTVSGPSPAAGPKSPGNSSSSTTGSSYGSGKVRISSVNPSSYSQVATIGLYTNLSQGETLDLDGWKIRTKENEIFIPKALGIYYPGGIASSLNVQQTIVLKSGDTVLLSSSRSALGFNFRLNKCMGYLENLYHLQPALPLNCPRPYSDRSEIIGFSSSCQDYITSLPACVSPPSNPPIPNFPYYDYGCQNFLQGINYEGCFTKHRDDADFASHEWRVFLDYSHPESDLLDVHHDRVQLLNRAGAVIDEYIY